MSQPFLNTTSFCFLLSHPNFLYLFLQTKQPLECLEEFPLAGTGMLHPELALRGRGAEILELCLKSCLGQGSSILLLSISGKIRAYSHSRVPTCTGTRGLQHWGWLLLHQTDTGIFGSLCGQHCNSSELGLEQLHLLMYQK